MPYIGESNSIDPKDVHLFWNSFTDPYLQSAIQSYPMRTRLRQNTKGNLITDGKLLPKICLLTGESGEPDHSVTIKSILEGFCTSFHNLAILTTLLYAWPTQPVVLSWFWGFHNCADQSLWRTYLICCGFLICFQYGLKVLASLKSKSWYFLFFTLKDRPSSFIYGEKLSCLAGIG